MKQTNALLIYANKILYRRYMFRHHASKVHLLVSKQFSSIKINGLNNVIKTVKIKFHKNNFLTS